MNTYEQLYKIVSPDLFNFRTDLEKHDKEMLSKYNGPFIYGYRRSGTDLIRLLPTLDSYEYSKDCPLNMFKKILREDIIWITYSDRNTKFLYFDGTKLHHKTKQQIEQIYTNHCNQLFNNIKQAV